jgi:hypothetical protein
MQRELRMVLLCEIFYIFKEEDILKQMSRYDKIEGFRYWDPEGWRGFVQEHIVPLYLSSQKLLRFREEVLSRTGGKRLSEIDSDMLKFLLGGVTEEGDYDERARALTAWRFSPRMPLASTSI